MMEQANAGKCHCDTVLITCFNHIIIPYRASGLRNILYPTLMGTFNIVSKREECIRA